MRIAVIFHIFYTRKIGSLWIVDEMNIPQFMVIDFQFLGNRNSQSFLKGEMNLCWRERKKFAYVDYPIKDEVTELQNKTPSHLVITGSLEGTLISLAFRKCKYEIFHPSFRTATLSGLADRTGFFISKIKFISILVFCFFPFVMFVRAILPSRRNGNRRRRKKSTDLHQPIDSISSTRK